MEMKWSSANDAMPAYIRIATGYRLCRAAHGCVSLVLFFGDQPVFFVQSMQNPSNEFGSLDVHFLRFGGPMKCTPSGTVWCHLTCALWLPELKFADYVKMVEKRQSLLV